MVMVGHSATLKPSPGVTGEGGALHLRREDADVGGKVEGGGDTGDGREVQGLKMMRPCNVQQQHVRLDSVRRPVVFDDRFM